MVRVLVRVWRIKQRAHGHTILICLFLMYHFLGTNINSESTVTNFHLPAFAVSVHRCLYCHDAVTPLAQVPADVGRGRKAFVCPTCCCQRLPRVFDILVSRPADVGRGSTLPVFRPGPKFRPTEAVSSPWPRSQSTSTFCTSSTFWISVPADRGRGPSSSSGDRASC